ncbi:MAG: hypothetical protein R6W93_04455 [Candidatus Limnocylindrales bacterium]
MASVGGWACAAPERNLLGASGAELVTIAAQAPATAVVSASDDQPWEGGDKGAWSVGLTVEAD